MCDVSPDVVSAKTQCDKHVIITSKRRFDVIITCLLHCVCRGNCFKNLEWLYSAKNPCVPVKVIEKYLVLNHEKLWEPWNNRVIFVRLPGALSGVVQTALMFLVGDVLDASRALLTLGSQCLVSGKLQEQWRYLAQFKHGASNWANVGNFQYKLLCITNQSIICITVWYSI